MAPPAAPSGSMAFNLWKPVFEDEELPAEFPESLRKSTNSIGAKRVTRDQSELSYDDHSDAVMESDDEPDVAMPSPQKRIRLPGGSAAAPKRVVAHLDDDDEFLKAMKLVGERDDVIAEMIAHRGGPGYSPKTIATRYSRIKRVQQAAQDEVLDDELTDWHEGEDDFLNEAYEEATVLLAAEYKSLESRKWDTIRHKMREKMQNLKYSKKACLGRWTDLRNNTAEPVFESDPDPVGRRAKALARVESRRQDKKMAMETERITQAEKQAKREAKQAMEEGSRIKREAHQAKLTAALELKAANEEAARREKEAKQKEKDDKVAERKAMAKQHEDERVKNEKLKLYEKAQAQNLKKLNKLDAEASKAAAATMARIEKLRAEEAELVRLQTSMVNKAILYEYMGFDQSVSQPAEDDDSIASQSAKHSRRSVRTGKEV